MGKETYRITEQELSRMISEAMLDFGIKTRKQNRLNTFKYARLYSGLVAKVQAIANQLNQRATIIQSMQQGQMNEGAAGLGVKGLLKGAKTGLKAANKVYGKRARRGLLVGALASMAAVFAGVPQNIGQRIEQFKNPGYTKPSDVIEGYGELAEWMKEMCQVTQEHPELLGTAALQADTLNGPEDVKGNKFSLKDGAELAASVGISFIPVIGWAYDAVDIAGSLVAAKADSDQEGLKVVEKQYQYIEKAVADMNNALAQSNSPQARTNIQQQQQPQVQQQVQQTATNMPMGYVIGKPAPFASTDPQQVARLQMYLGLQGTGRWDRNTQIAWDRWLQNTYQA